MVTPQQGWLAAESESLARADFSERDRATAEDHAAHAPGRTCIACGRTIEAGQDARRSAEQDWVHDVCPSPPDARPLAAIKPGKRDQRALFVLNVDRGSSRERLVISELSSVGGNRPTASPRRSRARTQPEALGGSADTHRPEWFA